MERISMKILTSIIFTLFIGSKIVLTADPSPSESWNSYKIQFNKQYETTELEQQKMKIFLENEKKVAQHNEKFKKGEVKFTMALNHFSDLTPEEMKQVRSGSKDSPRCAAAIHNYPAHLIKALPPNLGKAPESKDWSREGAVTSVKKQILGNEKCGCCWAFSAVGAIEAHNFLYGPEKKLVSLSVQQLLDCMGSQYGSNSCVDGCETSAFQYIIDNGGIEADRTYPYRAKEGKCQYHADKKVAVIKDFKTPVSNNEKLLKEIVGLLGPCTCGFDAEDDFLFYSSGIYSGITCGKTTDSINHAFLIVGYDSEDGIDYWWCKNQWGTEWGMDGYAKIQRNTNECAIALANYYPII